MLAYSDPDNDVNIILYVCTPMCNNFSKNIILSYDIN